MELKVVYGPPEPGANYIDCTDTDLGARYDTDSPKDREAGKRKSAKTNDKTPPPSNAAGTG